MSTNGDRQAFIQALKKVVNELFKRDAHLDQINLEQFWAFFEGRELAKVTPLIQRLVEERSFGHFGVEPIEKSEIRGDTFKCRVYLRFVQMSEPGDTGRPHFRAFAIGPRPGVVAH